MRGSGDGIYLKQFVEANCEIGKQLFRKKNNTTGISLSNSTNNFPKCDNEVWHCEHTNW